MSIRKNLDELNDMILQGNILDAFEKFYAEDVVMEDVGQGERHGKDANREYEEQFVSSLTDFRGAEIKSIAVNEETNTSMVEWWMDFTHKEWGDTILSQVAVQKWRNGKIVNEKFYHN